MREPLGERRVRGEQREEIKDGQLCRVGFRRRDGDFRAGVEVNNAFGFARKRAREPSAYDELVCDMSSLRTNGERVKRLVGGGVHTRNCPADPEALLGHLTNN